MREASSSRLNIDRALLYWAPCDCHHTHHLTLQILIQQKLQLFNSCSPSFHVSRMLASEASACVRVSVCRARVRASLSSHDNNNNSVTDDSRGGVSGGATPAPARLPPAEKHGPVPLVVKRRQIQPGGVLHLPVVTARAACFESKRLKPGQGRGMSYQTSPPFKRDGSTALRSTCTASPNRTSRRSRPPGLAPRGRNPERAPSPRSRG